MSQRLSIKEGPFSLCENHKCMWPFMDHYQVKLWYTPAYMHVSLQTETTQ